MKEVELSKGVYSLKSIKDTIYWFGIKYEIIISENEKNFIVKCFNPDDEFFGNFLTSLNDYSLRDTIENDTKDIKSLVIAKAFFPDMVDFNSVGEFEDPINIEARNDSK